MGTLYLFEFKVVEQGVGGERHYGSCRRGTTRPSIAVEASRFT